MQNWLLQNLSDVLNQELELRTTLPQTACCLDVEQINEKQPQKYYSQKHRLAELNAQREWRGAIASVEEILLAEITSNQQLASAAKSGLVFSAPVPLLSNCELVSNFQSAIFTPDAFKVNMLMPCRQSPEPTVVPKSAAVIELPLIPQDPIAQEQFCLVLTANFGLVLVLGTDAEGNPKFHFSFDPVTLSKVWNTLRSRLVITKYHHLEELDRLVEQFAPPTPDYQLVTNFSRLLLHHIPDLEFLSANSRQVETVAATAESAQSVFQDHGATSFMEMELLQALTHEIRTPLTTIRTLTKLLLKRKQDFKPNVIQRLQTIDRECREQIERMELIFRAAELESTSPSAKPVELVAFSLEQVFQQSIPRWQEKAKRRNVELDFTLPSNLPRIVSDPRMLDTVLTGVMESCTRSLPTGGHIDVKISTAGNQLKLQVLSQASNSDNPFKSLGQLLTFQPATGCLGLNLDATKNIFQALGGKLTVRQRQEQGKELTIFLPLNNSYQTSKV
ncbi:sensor histidine kinase [Pleurocapsa sp. CCALA 161]|uniref:sensor histidine kinase n=1 Tax=Pleurocapsa sp. CCALA 161 TaxID=2107688 RepID=UPI000D0506FA|nr:HAMP domain-containing sensor histidine kinase [Pleurocapsa sp. CCALA 161]PSB09602.1 sensor histidine kinase [Pleurocapsa sp. CCALA 161]